MGIQVTQGAGGDAAESVSVTSVTSVTHVRRILKQHAAGIVYVLPKKQTPENKKAPAVPGQGLVQKTKKLPVAPPELLAHIMAVTTRFILPEIGRKDRKIFPDFRVLRGM